MAGLCGEAGPTGGPQAQGQQTCKTATTDRDDAGQRNWASLRFDQPGRYEYLCGLYPFMRGQVIVQG